MLIFDIEADGLLDKATKIHLICWYNTDTDLYGWTTNIRWGVDYLMDQDGLAGHNIIGYDLPLIKKLTGREYQGIVLDTLICSRLMYPDIGSHSLEVWGERLGTKKPEIHDWSEFNISILNRCEEDVKINLKLFNKIVGDIKGWGEAIELEHKVAKIHQEQEEWGVWFDKEKAEGLVKELDSKRKEIDNSLYKVLPSVYHNPFSVPIKKPYKKNGELSKSVRDWFKGFDTPKIKGVFTRVEPKKFNLNSTHKLKEYLLSEGWKPTDWNVVREQDGSWRRTSPKLTEDSFNTIKGDTGKLIAERQIISHRRRIVKNEKDESKGMIATCREDGRVPAEAVTCGTPTGRYRHQRSVCNLPRPSTLYGEELRSLFSSPPDSQLVGIDLSGIEARVMCHYSLPFKGGKELAELVLEGDFHQHNARLWGVTRNTAKGGLYALMYGAGAKKLADTLGKPVKEGGKLRDMFWNGNPALKELKAKVEEVYKKKGYLTGLDKRKIVIRSEHKLLNSLFQCGATVIFKRWMVRCNEWIKDNNIPAHQVIAYHDELQFEVQGGMFPAMVMKQVEKEATLTGEEMGIRVKIEAEGKIGETWSDTH